MADKKITQDPQATSMASTDILPIVSSPSSTPTNKSITRTNFMGGVNITQVVGTIESQTLLNKTITSPLGLVAADISNLTATYTELNYVHGVTSALQTQLNLLAPLTSPTFTGTVTLPVALSGIAKLTAGVVSAVTAPSGTIVGTTDTQALSNKTISQRVATYSPAGAGTTTLDLSTGGIQSVTMPANTQTLAISNGTTGQCFIVEINNVTSQGALTWFTTIRWAGGTAPTLTGTNGTRDTFGFRVTGAGTYDGYIVGQNI